MNRFRFFLKTALGTLAIIATTAPGIIITPILTALGFTPIGPVFGTSGPVFGGLAAGYQSVFGTNAVFSLSQSAAMGGYGAPVIAGAVKVAGAVGATFGVARGVTREIQGEDISSQIEKEVEQES